MNRHPTNRVPKPVSVSVARVIFGRARPKIVRLTDFFSLVPRLCPGTLLIEALLQEYLTPETSLFIETNNMKRLLIKLSHALTVSSLLLAFATQATCLRADDNPGEEAPQNRLSAAEISSGWINLFDGKTFFGWKPNNDVNWQITDGVIHADKGDPGLLLTTTEFADYELHCDFRLEKGGNSGIFLRSIFSPKDPTQDCYELNMCDSHPTFPTGSLVGLVKPDKPVSGEENG